MIDIVLIVLIIMLSFKGYFNGAVRELVGFIGLIGGVFVASRAAEPVAAMIRNSIHMGNPALLKLLGFLLILGIIWGGSSFVAMIFTSLKAQPHSTLSKLLGMGIAGFKYFLIFALISASLLGSTLIRDNFAKSIQSSRILPTLSRIGSSLINLTPFTLNVSDPTTKKKERKDG
jgi:membrane protein required for colicin V production